MKSTEKKYRHIFSLINAKLIYPSFSYTIVFNLSETTELCTNKDIKGLSNIALKKEKVSDFKNCHSKSNEMHFSK